MKLEPFNISRALYGDPVVTRAGKRILELYRLSTSNLKYPVVAVIENYGSPSSFTIDGKSVISGLENEDDLFMAPKIEKRWVNLYYNPITGSFYHDALWDRWEDAMDHRVDMNFVKQIEVEIPC